MKLEQVLNNPKTLQEFFSADGRFDELIFYHEFEDAFVGLAWQFNHQAVIYNRQKCIEILMSHDMSEDEAIEYFEFNYLGAYLGESTPIFFTPIEPSEIFENKAWLSDV